MTATIDELIIADDPGRGRPSGSSSTATSAFSAACECGWSARARDAGSSAGRCAVPRGTISTGFRRPDPTSLRRSRQRIPTGSPAVDHVVAITPRLERTVASLEAAGIDLRRIREEPTPAGAPRQAFFRLGEVILEVIQEPDEAIERGGGAERPAFFWGLALTTPDIDATAAALGDQVGSIRAAVQPGRRIATLRRSAGLSLPVALITPPPPRT